MLRLVPIKYIRCMLQKLIQLIMKRMQIVVLAVGVTAAVMMMAALYCRSRQRGGRQPVTRLVLDLPVQESPDGRSGPSRVL